MMNYNTSQNNPNFQISTFYSSYLSIQPKKNIKTSP